ncbi:hypothetical protein [Sulfitobacter sp. W074]|uniref:hypothetical protein n=1 Tax=Sulfitobacter sp. W074 TaxID=2867026 RepID=UPI0021A865E2|nr:hypothetical protein [Sulfitobacter sp. W074]UWR39481.1 hypothetical protein K3762_18150 [Sulfitobacter sp. W074]UWR39615.1 hypothetical protein K3762_19510 [Sulfitobacter sp. W074]
MSNMPMPDQIKHKRRRTKAERQESAATSRSHDANKRAQGLVRTSHWVAKDDLAAVKSFIATRAQLRRDRLAQTQVFAQLEALKPFKKPTRGSKHDPRQARFDFG